MIVSALHGNPSNDDVVNFVSWGNSSIELIKRDKFLRPSARERENVDGLLAEQFPESFLHAWVSSQVRSDRCCPMAGQGAGRRLVGGFCNRGFPSPLMRRLPGLPNAGVRAVFTRLSSTLTAAGYEDAIFVDATSAYV